MNPNPCWRFGYTDSLLKRPAHCIFASWYEAQEYLRGYLFGDETKRRLGI